jgi:hypothetical protein
MITRKGHLYVAQMLVECGADMSAQDKIGGLRCFRRCTTVIWMWHGCPCDVVTVSTCQHRRSMGRLHCTLRPGSVMWIRYGCSWSAAPTCHRSAGEVWVDSAAPCAQDRSCGYGTDAHGARRRRVTAAQAKYGSTPLHHAPRIGHVDTVTVRMLVERGADVSAKYIDAWTPLHWASNAGHVDVGHWHVARMLVERGANVSVTGGLRLTRRSSAVKWM